jgi:LuxR family transcriptional regulator, maltose regulon positive regulatory protein
VKPAVTPSASSLLLRTRFYRPSLPSDLVDRPRLIELLNCSSDRPLTLVTAPAGYGKSILVSAWLKACGRPSAWLSLDDTVDDLGVFLAHFVAAVQTVFPGALRRTQALLTAVNLPPVGVPANSLINELDELEHDFVMVLDDYHTIHQQDIHDLVSALLRPPARRMRLVLITRKDPPLPKSALLAGNQMTELRLSDLRFSAAETAAFMRNALGSPLPDEAVAGAYQALARVWSNATSLAATCCSSRFRKKLRKRW